MGILLWPLLMCSKKLLYTFEIGPLEDRIGRDLMVRSALEFHIFLVFINYANYTAWTVKSLLELLVPRIGVPGFLFGSAHFSFLLM